MRVTTVHHRTRLATAAVISASSLITCAGHALAGEAPVKAWELAGFEAPESALPDVAAGVVYVSNVAGKPTDKDGVGYISKVSPEGKMIEAKWIDGLNAPKGLVKSGDKLYVSDIDRLVEIDVTQGKVVGIHEAPGAEFLNDTAVDGDGNIYVSDMMTNTIWRLAGGKLEVWLKSDDLQNPNGLLVEGDTLIVAAWGKMTDGWATKVPGHLLKVSLTEKSVSSLGDGTPIGNLDGLEPLDGDTFLVSDWMNGKVYKVARSGKATEILTLTQGSADLGYAPTTKLAFIPMMNDGKLLAYRMGD